MNIINNKEQKRLDILLSNTADESIEEMFKKAGLAYEKCNLNNARRALKLINDSKILRDMPISENNIGIEHDDPLSPAFKNCTVLLSCKGGFAFMTHAEREVFGRLVVLADEVRIYAEKDFPDDSTLTGNVAISFNINNIWSD